MPGVAPTLPLPLPRGWPRRVRSAVVQVISLAGASMAATRGWAFDSMNPSLRQRADVDRLQQEVRLLREEIRIKPEFVGYVVRRLKALCPAMGRVRIARVLARAGLHLGPTTVRRMLHLRQGVQVLVP